MSSVRELEGMPSCSIGPARRAEVIFFSDELVVPKGPC